MLIRGNCLDILPEIAEASIDAVVTDPPYGLAFMGKVWDAPENVAFRSETWRVVLRTMKPGAHLAAFGGTRTYHRMACAIEDAGFEIRDQLGWMYGTGFPKSLNLGEGRGTALKPAWEPICLARKPLSEKTVAANVLRHGTGALNIDATRIDMSGETVTTGQGTSDRIYGGGKGLRPAEMGTQAFQSHALGRWPANLVHDGSPEVLACFPERKSGSRKAGEYGVAAGQGVYGEYGRGEMPEITGDSGSAARFFYAAKASKADRAGSKHPTVKPVALMRWLVRLITPPGGLVLDPFAGSGTAAAAAIQENRQFTLIEQQEEYCQDIEKRLAEV